MRHKVTATLDNHPYEIIRVELIAENSAEDKSIKAVDEIVQDYLLFTFNTVEIVESQPPVFLLKRAKQKLGLG